MSISIILCIYVVIIFCLKYVIYITLPIQEETENKKNKSSYLISCIYAILSMDYFLSAYFKNKVLKEGGDITVLLKRFNYLNIALSFFLFFLFFLFKLDCPFFYSIVYIRVFYRGVEIIISFLKDVLSPIKTSKLEYSDRVRLAIFSLIEIMFLFAIIYAKWSNIYDSLIYSIGMTTLLDINLTYEVENDELRNFSSFKKIVATFHVIIAAVLIVLSLAQYIGNTKSISEKNKKSQNRVINHRKNIINHRKNIINHQSIIKKHIYSITACKIKIVDNSITDSHKHRQRENQDTINRCLTQIAKEVEQFLLEVKQLNEEVKQLNEEVKQLNEEVKQLNEEVKQLVIEVEQLVIEVEQLVIEVEQSVLCQN